MIDKNEKNIKCRFKGCERKFANERYMKNHMYRCHKVSKSPMEPEPKNIIDNAPKSNEETPKNRDDKIQLDQDLPTEES